MAQGDMLKIKKLGKLKQVAPNKTNVAAANKK